MDHLGALKALIVRDGRIELPSGASERVNGMARTVAEQVPLKMRPKHRYVVMLHEMGYSNKEIASMVGYSETRVSIILNWKGQEVDQYRQDAQQKLTDRTVHVADRINDAASEAFDIMLTHARAIDKDRTNSRLAARDILHMAGYSPVKKTASINANVQVPPELQAAVTQLDKFQEVKAKEGSWAVKEPEQRTGTNG